MECPVSFSTSVITTAVTFHLLFALQAHQTLVELAKTEETFLAKRKVRDWLFVWYFVVCKITINNCNVRSLASLFNDN